ncbi:unnamed protein product, partial [Discosporangium mesarthrocarpum]
DWNVYWANVYTVKQIFNPDNGFRLADDQLSTASTHYLCFIPRIVCRR